MDVETKIFDIFLFKSDNILRFGNIFPKFHKCLERKVVLFNLKIK